VKCYNGIISVRLGIVIFFSVQLIYTNTGSDKTVWTMRLLHLCGFSENYLFTTLYQTGPMFCFVYAASYKSTSFYRSLPNKAYVSHWFPVLGLACIRTYTSLVRPWEGCEINALNIIYNNCVQTPLTSQLLIWNRLAYAHRLSCTVVLALCKSVNLKVLRLNKQGS
jgi:hypothetical protein